MMNERYVQPDNNQQLDDVAPTTMSDELLSVEYSRSAVHGVAGYIDAEVVNHSLDLLRQELGPEGSVKRRIEELQGYIYVVERRLALANSRQNIIELRMLEPQKVHDWAKKVLEEIDERKTNIAQQIQDLQKQKSSAANRDEIGRLQHELNYSDAGLHHRAWNARINASADLKRLSGVLASVVAGKNIYLEELAKYQGEMHELSDRLAKVSASLGGFVASMTDINALASSPYVGSEIFPPQLPPDIDIDIVTRPLSYGDHPSFANDENGMSYLQSPEHPANTLEFPDAVSVEVTVESSFVEEIEQPNSLEPLLREKVKEAQSAPRVSKKSGRINNFLKSKKMRV